MSLLDLTGVQEQSFKPLQAGRYMTTITEAKVEPMFSGKGDKLSVKIKVLDKDHENRILFHSFNIKHENKDAELIGKQQLKSLMGCVGIGSVLNSVNDLCGKKFMTVTKIEKDQNGEDRAKVKYFEPLDLNLASATEETIPF